MASIYRRVQRCVENENKENMEGGGGGARLWWEEGERSGEKVVGSVYTLWELILM